MRFSLICRINCLSRIILFSLLMRFSWRFSWIYRIRCYWGLSYFPYWRDFNLIYRMWAFQIIHDRPLGRADWAFVLGWRQGPGCFTGRTSSLGLASGHASPFFKPYQLPPCPCVLYAWARDVTFLVSYVISTRLLGAGLVRALSPSYFL